MTRQQETLFAFGLGYTARALAARLGGDGWRVIGTRRSAETAQAMAAAGLQVQVFNTETPPDPPAGAHWLISVPPLADGCPVATNPAVRAVAAEAGSVTYLSTTGVYGDLGGGWAFEWSPVNPGSDRARRRVLAEAQWRALCPGATIVRLPGIYGPGRSPFERLRAGKAQRIIKPGQVFSRAHVDDIASALAALVRRPDLGGVFHVCDDLPAPPQDVTAYAAELAGLPVPPDVPFETANLSEMARSFYAECKRVSNARTRAALGWQPAYPTYREGLVACLEDTGTSGPIRG